AGRISGARCRGGGFSGVDFSANDAATFPSPLVGEGGARSAPDEGSLSAETTPWRRDDSNLRAKTLRRTRDRGAAARGHLHDSQAAFVAAVGAETEQAVDAGESGRVGQHLGRKPLPALGS